MEFVESGVPNLDFVLGGGLVEGSLTMVVGRPGSGKTILAHQVAFHAARQGRKVLVLTTLPEPHVKLLNNLRTLHFFDERLLGERIELHNVYRQLREDFANAGTNIVRLVRDSHANLLVLDSFDSLRGLARDETPIKEFVYELSAGLGLLGVTVVIVSAFDPHRANEYTELTIADQIVMLHSGLAGMRGVRQLEVTKMRGAAQRAGLHSYAIDATGLRVYPRQESAPPPPEVALSDERIPFGLPDLDAMMGQGPPQGSTTLLVGNPGTGKTLLALQFLLAGHRRGERGLFIGFHETAQQLALKAAGVGMDLSAALADGIEIVHRVAAELDADEVATTVRAKVAADGVRRLVIDNVDELLKGVLEAGRRHGFLASLGAYVCNLGVTTVAVQEVAATTLDGLVIGTGPISTYADNIVLTRHLEHRAALHRIISVLKMRNSDHDRTIREFTIGPGGPTILTREESDSGVLDALGRP